MRDKAIGKRNKNILIVSNFICHARSLDVNRLIHYFKANGCCFVKSPEEAGHIILMTCGVFKIRQDQCMNILSRLKDHKSRLIVVGCLPGIAEKRLKKVFHGQTITTKNLGRIDRLFRDFKIKFKDIPDQNFFAKRGLVTRQRDIKEFRDPANAKEAYLRVSNGCLNACAYCVIRPVIGRLVSKPLKDCVKEYRRLLDSGYREFMFIGDDIGSYGLDIKSSFPRLLQELSRCDKSYRVKWKFRFFNPRWLVKYESELLAYIKKGKITYMNCDIQSGNNRILKLMARGYDIKDVTRVLLSFKKVNPGMELATDYICGFPSESEEEFLESIGVIKKINFDFVWLRMYSDNQKALSFRLPDKVPAGTIYKRLKKSAGLLKRAGIKFDIELPGIAHCSPDEKNTFWVYADR